MKDRTRHARHARSATGRAWTKANTQVWKLWVDGVDLGEINVFAWPGKTEIPPFGNRKWCKFLRGLGVDVYAWHRCVLVGAAETLAWREKCEQATPRRRKQRDLDLRRARIRVFMAGRLPVAT